MFLAGTPPFSKIGLLKFYGYKEQAKIVLESTYGFYWTPSPLPQITVKFLSASMTHGVMYASPLYLFRMSYVLFLKLKVSKY